MRWLRRDEGIVMVLVGGLLVVLLGIAGMAIDMGALYAERRELRNGADAAALAIAEDCGHMTKPCNDATALATARDYANWNAHDGVSGVDPGDLTLDTAARTVRVVTHAVEAATNESGVRTPLMGLFGPNRREVRAAATAEWGYPASGQGLPLIVESSYYSQLGGNTGYIAISKDAPGAFGWLDLTPGLESRCQAFATVGTWNPIPDPGVSPPSQSHYCTPDVIEGAIFNKDVPVFMYSGVRGGGHNTEYYVVGIASFHVIGYDLGSGQAGGFRQPDGFACPPETDKGCLQGYFTSATIPDGETGGPNNFGVVIVKLTE